MSYTILKEEDPERYGVWFNRNSLLVMLQIEDGQCTIAETKGKGNAPSAKLKTLWSSSLREFLLHFAPDSDKLDREKAFDNYIKYYLEKKK